MAIIILKERIEEAEMGPDHGDAESLLNTNVLQQLKPSMGRLWREKDMIDTPTQTWADNQVANNPAPRLNYVLLTERLATKIASYDEEADKMAYLSAVAHIFSS